MVEKRYSCLNGRLVRADRAAVAVTDRGFRFGDGIFETIRLVRGVPYQWELHMTRLAAGLAAVRIPTPVTDWAAPARRVLRRNRAKEGFLRITVSRGTGSRGYLPFPPEMPPTWVIEYLPALPPAEDTCSLWLSSLARVPAACLPVQHKLAQGLGSTLALIEARDHGCPEALQLTLEGLVCEAASANLFWIREKTLYTPALDTGCLAGTTRDAVLRLSPVACKTVRAGLSTLEGAEAVFLTNCRYGIWPVAEILPMGWRYPRTHPLLRRLMQRLTRDYAIDATRHRKAWGRA